MALSEALRSIKTQKLNFTCKMAKMLDSIVYTDIYPYQLEVRKEPHWDQSLNVSFLVLLSVPPGHDKKYY